MSRMRLQRCICTCLRSRTRRGKEFTCFLCVCICLRPCAYAYLQTAQEPKAPTQGHTNSWTHELMDMGHLIDHANAREGGKCKNETHGVLKKVVA